jgi:HK97 family phage major capsid protein
MTINVNVPSRRGIQCVRADTSDMKGVLNELQKTFEEFKAENDKKINEVKKGFDDVVSSEKIERINSSLADLQKAYDEQSALISALQVGPSNGRNTTKEAREYSAAFEKFFRRGTEANLGDLAVKASLTKDSNSDGGYLVPEEMSNTIDRVVGTVSVMRDLASVIQISTDTYKKLVSLGGATSGWVSEKESRSETTAPNLSEIAINTAEIYANPAATNQLLDDAQVDIAQWLADEVAITFAEQEGAAFINGDGVGKPRGLLQHPTVANANYAWKSVGFIVSGNATGFATSNPTDRFMDLYYALKQQYRNGATWLTSDAVLGQIRKFKDGQGNYIWSPPTVDMPATILGKPVRTDDNMPALGANAFPVAFGNFQRAYLIVDRFGTRVLRDPFTNKPYVNFYTTKRVGGAIQNFEAVKLLKCST